MAKITISRQQSWQLCQLIDKHKDDLVGMSLDDVRKWATEQLGFDMSLNAITEARDATGADFGRRVKPEPNLHKQIKALALMVKYQALNHTLTKDHLDAIQEILES